MFKKLKNLLKSNKKALSNIDFRDSKKNPTEYYSPYFLNPPSQEFHLLAIKEGLLPDIPDITWLDKLGEGSFGAVYSAYDHFQKMNLAVKKVHPDKVRRYGNLQLFLDECQNWIDLDLHLNIVNCYYVKSFGNTPYIFMEYVPYGSVEKLISDGEICSLQQILQFAHQSAVGLRYIHNKGIIHQDIKPANILIDIIDDTPVAKISDFTLSSKLDQIGEGSLKGCTVYFASPEQLAHIPKITAKSDLWNWAVTVLQMCTQSNNSKWIRGDETPTFIKDYYRLYSSHSKCVPIPENLYKLLSDCLQPDPVKRPENMGEVADRLKEIYRQEFGKPLQDIQVDPTILNAINENNKGVSYWSIGSYQESLQCFDNALAKSPNYLTALYNQFLVRWAVGILPSDTLAINGLKHRLGNTTEDGYLFYLLGRLYLYAMHAEEASEAFNNAQRLNPDDQSISQYIEELENKKIDFLHYIAELKGHTTDVEIVNISKDGTRAISTSLDKTIRVWDLVTNKCLAIIEYPTEYVFSVSLDSTGQMSAASDYNGMIWVWNTSNLKCISKMKIEHKNEDDKQYAKYSIFLPDSDLLISADGHSYVDRELSLRIWNYKTGECLKIIPAHQDQINSLVLSPDGTRLVTAGNDNFVKVWLWKPKERTVECIASFEGNRKFSPETKISRNEREYISYADIDHTNRYLLTGNKDSSIILYDIKMNKKVVTLRGHSGYIYRVGWIDGWKFAISSSMDETKIWDIPDRICLSTFPNKRKFHVSAFTQNQKNIIIPEGNSVLVWFAGNILPLRPVLIIDKITPAIKQIEVSQAVRQSLSRVETLIEQQAWEDAYKWLREFKKEHCDFRHHPYAHQLSSKIEKVGKRIGISTLWLDGTISWEDRVFGSSLCGLDVSKDGSKVVAASFDGVILVANISDKRITKLLHSNDETDCIKIINNKRIATGIRGGVITIWDLNTLEVDKHISRDEKSASCVRSLYYNELSDRIAMINNGFITKTCAVYNLQTSETIFEQTPEELTFSAEELIFRPGFSTVCLSTTGRLLLLGGSREKLSLWDIEQKKKVHDLIGHTGDIIYTAFYDSDRMAISVGKDSTIQVWNLKSGRCIKTIRCTEGEIVSVCMTSDKRYLVILDKNRSISLWSLDNFDCIVSYQTNVQIELSLIAITPDSNYIISGGHDRTILVYGVDWEYDFPKTMPDSHRPQPRVLSLPDGAKIYPFINCGHTSDISALASYNYQYLLSGSFDTTIKVWDLFQNGLCVKTFAKHTAKITAIFVVPGGEDIFSSALDKKVIRWDFKTERVKQVFDQEKTSEVMAVTPDSQLLFTGCEDGTIYCYGSVGEKPLRSIKLEYNISSMFIPSDGNYLFIGTSQGDIIVLDLQTLKQSHKIDGTSRIVRILPKENQEIYIGDARGNIRIVRIGTFETLKTISSEHRFSDFFVQGHTLVTCNFNFNHSEVVIQDMETGLVKKEIRNIGWIRSIAAHSMFFFFVGLPKGNILLVNTSTGEFSGLLSGIDDHILCVKISPNKRYIISGYYDCFRIYDLKTGHVTKFEDKNNILDVDFSTDSQFAFAKNYDKKVYHVNLASMSIVQEYESSQLGNINTLTGERCWTSLMDESNNLLLVIRNVEGIHLFQQGKMDELHGMDENRLKDVLNKLHTRYMIFGSLSSDSSHSVLDEIILVDMYAKDKDDKPPEPIRFQFDKKDYLNGITKAIICDDNVHLITVGFKGIIKIWDIPTKNLIRTIQDEEDDAYSTKSATMFSNNILISGCWNGKIKLWNIHTGEQIHEFKAHNGQITWVSMSPDQQIIVSGGASDGVKIWSSSTFELLSSLVMLSDDNYAFYTPYNDFYLSDPQHLQFEKVTIENESICRLFVSNENDKQQYRAQFVNLRRVLDHLGC